ncbi:MAG: multifunctional 2-oxoglutarate metabolism enzyme, partial [Nocardioidaceae bacterium]|nr:multifunctional 2-oxoglutarate metabolism enzyme [Nocardioidaceae bacterium]
MEEAIQAVPESSKGAPSTGQSAEDPLADFGANEWLVDEMYERYQNDPDSLDKVWWDFFSSERGTNGANGSKGTSAPPKAQPEAQPGARPEARPQSQSTVKAEPTTPTTPVKPATAPKPAVSAPTHATPRADARPAQPTSASPVPKEPEPAARAEAVDEPTLTVLRGAPARTAQNMNASLSVPTATSVRSVPVKLLIDNRIVINNHLSRARGGKVSFTHVIGWALVKALRSMPEMNRGFDVVDGKPTLITPAHINLGLAIDMAKPDGTRQLLVPSIKGTESMGFAGFWAAYEDIVRKARNNKLAVSDFQGTTVSLTNPGTIGTNHSVPRLMSGQGTIVGVGSMDYPPEYQGASEETLTRNAVSKVMTLTSTYDHRVIQGA